MPVKTDIQNLKQEIDRRIDDGFGTGGSIGFNDYFNKLGIEEKHWTIGTWITYLDGVEGSEKEDEEYKTRKGTVLYTLAKAFITFKLRQSVGAKKINKEAILKEIEDYQVDYTDPNEQAVYNDKEIKNKIQELKDTLKTTPTSTPFTKGAELKTLITNLDARIDGLFIDPDKSTFISEINTMGKDTHYWSGKTTWKTFLSEEEIKKQANKDKVSPDEEFDRRKRGVLYVLAKAYMEWWIYQGKNSSSKAKKKEAIAKIEDYQGKYTEPLEQTSYNEEDIKKDIQAIKTAIAKKPSPKPKPSKPDEDKGTWQITEAFVKVKNWWEGILDNYVKGDVARSNIEAMIDKQGRETDSKFTDPDTWQDWFKASKNQKELDEKWDWLEKEITKYLIDYWITRGDAEHDRQEKEKWWDNYIVSYYYKYKREIARHYYHIKTYNDKLMAFQTSFKVKETDLDKMKRNAIKEVADRMDELYKGTSLTTMITEINKSGTNDKSSDWGTDWKDCIGKGTDDINVLERKGYVLKYMTEYFIKDMLERIDDQTDDGLAARYFQKLSEYKEKYGLEMGTHEAFKSNEIKYKAAEDRLKNITAIGVPVDQVYTMIYARDYGRWAGKPARKETRQPRDDTGTQGYKQESNE